MISCEILRSVPCMIKWGTKASKTVVVEVLKVSREDFLEVFHLAEVVFKVDLLGSTWMKSFKIWQRSFMDDRAAWEAWGACSHPTRCEETTRS